MVDAAFNRWGFDYDSVEISGAHAQKTHTRIHHAATARTIEWTAEAMRRCARACSRAFGHMSILPFPPVSVCQPAYGIFFGKCREVDAGKQARKGKVFLKDTATREERRRLLACANPITSKKLSGQGTVQLLSTRPDPAIP